MLDRVTPRGKLRDELVTIIRMLTHQPPAVSGDLPAPAPEEAEESAATAVESASDKAPQDSKAPKKK